MADRVIPKISTENLLTNSAAPGTPGRKRGHSDLRSAAMLCHTQISKELWGKKQVANSFVDHVRPSEVEAFALDIALRAYWNLQRERDYDAQCSLSIQQTSLLRQITLDILQKNQTSLTKEYIFEIPDPEIIKQREEEKQEHIESSREQRKLKAEAAKKERAERAARMKAKREELAKKKSEEELKTDDKDKNTTITNPTPPEKIVQNAIKISSPTTRLKQQSPGGFSMEKKII